MIKKSKSDDRLYRYLKLQNDMRCILVHDNDVEKSSACLHVGVGSLYDPPHANGLAHFLEHMLFLGTKKYPQENSYSQYIQSHGGQKNAATAEDYTYYYFDIKNDAFAGAVDRFSQFFKEPLFTESATDREMNAVDSEYKKNLSDDHRRMFQLEKSIIVRQGSTLNRFSTGGLETLNYPTVRDDLLDFHAKNYSSNIMSLVMVGRDSLETLEQLAIEHFSGVENKNVQLRDFSKDTVYDDTSYGKLYKVVPYKNIKQLKITWNLPYSEDLWRIKPNSYISHIIGHEGPNSLLSYLIKEGLAVGLSCSDSKRMKCMDQIHVTVNLTEKGERDYIKVLESVYSFINKIRSEGIKDYTFEEKRAKNKVDFDYKTKTTALSYANNLSQRMQKVKDEDIEDILWRPHAYENFDKQEIQRRFDILTPKNSFVMFVSKQIENQESELSSEKWYGTKYSIQKFDDDLLQNLAQIFPPDTINFAHPPENKFIPRNLVVKKAERNDNQPQAFPLQISEDPQIWFKQDDTFDQPFVNCNLKIITNDCFYPITPLSHIFVVMWKACLDESLRELSYMAQLAGIDFTTHLGIEHLSCSIYGYNDGIQNFIVEVLQQLQNFKVDEAFFNDEKALKIRQYENMRKQEPYQRLEGRVLNCMLSHMFDIPEVLKSLKDELSFDKFMELKSKWLQNLKIEWLIMGHIEKDEALNLVDQCEKSFKYNKITKDEAVEQRLVKLPIKSVYEYEELNEDPSNPNSAVMAYFQHDLKSEEEQAINNVLFQLLKEPFFNQLRTNEQLGYIVSAGPQSLKKVIHGRFLVQSNVKGPDYLIHRINEFLKNVKQAKVDQLTIDDVEKAKNALIQNLMQKDLTIGHEANRYWNEILDEEYIFDRRQRKIEALRMVSQDQVINHFNEFLLKNPKRIDVKLYAHNHFNNKQEVNEFKKWNEEFYTDFCKVNFIEKIDHYKSFRMKHQQFPRL